MCEWILIDDYRNYIHWESFCGQKFLERDAQYLTICPFCGEEIVFIDEEWDD